MPCARQRVDVEDLFRGEPASALIVAADEMDLLAAWSG